MNGDEAQALHAAGESLFGVDLFSRKQIVSHDRQPKRYAFGPMAPLNLRFAGGRLCQQERRDVDCV